MLNTTPSAQLSTTITNLRTTCLSLLRDHQQHSQHIKAIGPFPLLNVRPKPILPQLAELTSEETTLLQTWRELKEVTYQRLLAEAWDELQLQGKLVPGKRGDEEERAKEELDKEERVIDQQIRELEQEAARLKLSEAIKERVTIAAVTAKEVSNTVYGVKSDASVPSLVKTRALRSLLHHHTTHVQLSTNLHNTLTTLQSTLQKLQSRHISQTTENRLLTTRLLSLTNQLSARSKKEIITDQQLRGMVEESEKQLKEAKLRWEVARNVFQAVVVASGVDWVRVEGGRIRELMLEAGEEIE